MDSIEERLATLERRMTTQGLLAPQNQLTPDALQAMTLLNNFVLSPKTPATSADVGNDGEIVRDKTGHIYFYAGGQWWKLTGASF